MVLEDSQGSSYLNTRNYKRSEIDVIVLMAGEGRRLLPLTSDRPKALLLCDNGISIFEHIVRAFVSKDLSATIIPVVGHGRHKVLDEVARLSKIAQFCIATNPFYLKAGPIISLWLGLMHSKSERVLVLNGDTIVKNSLVNNAMQWLEFNKKEMKPGIAICITKTNDLSRDDMKILVDDNESFLKAGKDILPKSNVMKSAGVMCIKNSFSKELLKEKLDFMLMNDNFLKPNYFWHNILNETKELLSISLIFVEETSWHEVDTIHDLKLMNESNY